MAREPIARNQADSAVDPTLAQKKRARHRLVGAIALCLLAALLIPLVLESEPRQPPRDIPLEIDPRSQPAPAQPVPSLAANGSRTGNGAAGAGSGSASASTGSSASQGSSSGSTSGAAAAGAAAAAVESARSVVRAVEAGGSPVTATPPKSEPRVEPRAETRPEPRVELRPEVRTEPRPVARAEPRPEPRVEPKAEAKATPRADAKAAARADPKGDTKGDAKGDARGEAKSAAKAEPRPGSDPLASLITRNDPPSRDASREAPKAVAGRRFTVQVGAFSSANSARAVSERVVKAGLKPYEEVVKTANGSVTRVRVGPFDSREAAERAMSSLKAAGVSAALVAL